MRSVELLRAERGAKKVSCTKLLQARCELGLARAKNATDAMLEGNRPVLTLPSDEEARAFIAELGSLGIRARFAEGHEYDPAAELAKAMLPLEGVLPTDAYQAITSLAEHGEWEVALSHCLANLPPPGGSVPIAVQERLRELALEFGASPIKPDNPRTAASDA